MIGSAKSTETRRTCECLAKPARWLLCATSAFLLGTTVALKADSHTIVGWDFRGVPTGAVESRAPTEVVDGVTPVDLTRGPGLNLANLNEGFSADRWSWNPVDEPGEEDKLEASRETAIETGEYYELGFTVGQGYEAYIQALDASFRRSAFNAPMNLEWQYSLDGFATDGITITPTGEIWDQLGWTEDVFTYLGRNSGSGIAVDYNYMVEDVGGQGSAGEPGNPMPTIDLRGISGLQAIPEGTTVTFRLYAWGNEDTTSTNTFAFGRQDGPIVSGAVVPAGEVPLTVLSDQEGTDPAPGAHSYASGTEVTATAPEEVALPGGLLYQVTGWTGTGSVPAEGEGNSVTFTITEPSTIEWQWQQPAAPAEPLVEYDLTGSTAEFQPATSHAEGVSPFDLSVGPGVNFAGLANGFSANGWDHPDPSREVAINEGRYFEFGFTVEDGNRAYLSSFDTALRRSALWGPLHLELQYSLDGFATDGVTIAPQGRIWDEIGWESAGMTRHGGTDIHWEEGTFIYRGRNSVGSTTVYRNQVVDYNYMTRDVSEQGANGIPGNAIPTIDLRGIQDLQGIPAGTTVTFRLFAWGTDDGVSSGNTLALGRYDGPVIGGAVAAEGDLPLTIVSTHPHPDPSPGVHRFPEGTEVTVTAPSLIEDGDGVRHNLLGWNATGSAPAEGTGDSITFTLNEATTIEWEWQTEHLLTVGAEGDGNVDVHSSVPVPVLGFDFGLYTLAVHHEDGVPALSVADSVQPTTIIRGSGLNARNLASGGMSSENWNGAPSFGAAVSANKYLEFSVTPAPGESIELHSVYVPYRYSATAAHSIALVYSFDDFETFTTAESLRIQDQASGTQIDRHLFVLPGDSRLQNVTEEVRFRIYGWGGTGSGAGTLALFNDRGTGSPDMIVFAGDSETASIPGTGSEELWREIQASIRAEAQPATDSVFTGWSGDFFGNNTLLSGLDMVRPLAFTANFATDSDGDGIPDFWKEQYFGDIDDPDAAAGEDPDGDGFDNREEYLRGTDPTVADELVSGDTITFSPWENAQRDPEVPGNWVVEDFGDGFRGAWESSNHNRSALDPFRADGESVTPVGGVSFEGPRLIVRDSVWEQDWSNATIETILSVGDDDGNMLYFRYQDELNWYRVTISGESNGASRPDIGVTVQKRVDGEYTELVAPSLEIATDPTDSNWFKRVRIVVDQNGDEFNIRIDGWDVFQDPPDWNTSFVFDQTITDSDHAHGRAGIGTWAQGGFPESADWNPVDAGALFESFTVTMGDTVVFDEDWEDAPLADELPGGWENPFLGEGLEGTWLMSAHGTLLQMSTAGDATTGTETDPAADGDGPILLAPTFDASTYVLDMGFHPFRTGSTGFVFDYVDEDNYGRVLFTNVLVGAEAGIPNGVVVSRKVDGEWTDLFIGDRSFVYELAQPFRVTLSRAGERYVMTAQETDGNPAPVHRWVWDDASGPSQPGRHGFASWGTNYAHYLHSDVFGVLDLPGEGLEVTGISVAGGVITLNVVNLPSTEPYSVQRTTDLNGGEWETVDTDRTGTTWTGPVPEGESRVFWRLIRTSD